MWLTLANFVFFSFTGSTFHRFGRCAAHLKRYTASVCLHFVFSSNIRSFSLVTTLSWPMRSMIVTRMRWSVHHVVHFYFSSPQTFALFSAAKQIDIAKMDALEWLQHFSLFAYSRTNKAIHKFFFQFQRNVCLKTLLLLFVTLRGFFRFFVFYLPTFPSYCFNRPLSNT